ncbi:MAG TPA: hypothetical protein VMC43_04030 [Candidatus Paceibacterota bacterium]|nr:hypothetical protein [Candidatus Paceibacterota bacterium]
MVRVLSVGLAVALLGSATGNVTPERRVVRALEAQLQTVVAEGERPIALRWGTAFTEPEGAVIFISRAAGRRRLVAMARTGEPELQILFLPRLQAWVTHTVWRSPDKVRIQTIYAGAAIRTEPDEPGLELWHVHNNLPDPETPNVLPQPLDSVTPSWEDLTQFFMFAREAPTTRIKGVIAHVYGTTEFWCERPDWTESRFVSTALHHESVRMADHVAAFTPAKLAEALATYDGIFKLRFTPVP